AIQVPALWIEISGISIPGISRICRHGVRDAMRPGVVARHGNAANGTALNRKDQTLITRRGTAVDAIESFAISSSIVSRYPRAMASKAHQLKRTAKESDYRALAEFRYHIGRYLDFSDQAAKAAGIEPRQYQLLLALRGLPKTVEPTVGALAQQLRSHHHSTVELINRAEANDLVKRLRVGTRVLVRLTRKGERILTQAVEQR